MATEIDFDFTLIAGQQRLVDDLVATTALEVWPIDPGDSLQEDADRIN